ncbi:MAG: hypothetical protein ABI675_17420 [Chitinophagaceae bacterium]
MQNFNFILKWFKKNKTPVRLPIKRMEDYHTHYLGETNDGRLFWAYETFVFPKPYSEIKDDDWKNHRKEYAMLHTFDKKGNYLATKHWLAGSAADTGGQSLDNKLEEMVKELGIIIYKDIKVKLFQTVIDGVTFGLIAGEENKTIELQPGSTISFQQPWDGEYYT